MALFDTTGTIYVILSGITTSITGSWFLTFLFIMLLAILACVVFGFPVDLSAIMVFPLAVYFFLYTSAFGSIMGVLIIYCAFLIAKNFFGFMK